MVNINPIVLAVLVSFIVSQTIKFIILFVEHEPHAVESLWREYGGMPSTHTALVSAVVFSVYYMEGFSTLFYVALVFSMIVIADVMDVKWFFGRRNDILNKVIALAQHKHRKKIRLLENHFGHSFPDVLVGTLIGWVVSMIVFGL